MIVSNMKVAMQRQGEEKTGLSVADLRELMSDGYPGTPVEIMLPDGLIYPVTVAFTVKRRDDEGKPRIVLSAGDVQIEGKPYVYDHETGEKRFEYTLVSEKDKQDFDKTPMAAIAEEVSSPEFPRRYFIIGTSFKDCYEYQKAEIHQGFRAKDALVYHVYDTDQFEALIEKLSPEDKRQVSSHWTKSAQDMSREMSEHDPMVNWYNTMIRLCRDAAGMDPLPEDQLGDIVAPTAGMAPKIQYVGVVAQTYEDANRYLASEPEGFKNDPNVKITILLSPRKTQVFLSETYGKDRKIVWTHQARLLLKRNHEDYVVMSDLLGNKGMGYEVTRIHKGYLVIGETLQDAAEYAHDREDISGRDGMGGEFFRFVTSPASMTSFINAREYDKVNELEVIWTAKAKKHSEANIAWGTGINGRILELEASRSNVTIKWVDERGVLMDLDKLDAERRAEAEKPNVHIVVGISQRDINQYIRETFKPTSPVRLRPGYQIEDAWSATELRRLARKLGDTPVRIYWTESLTANDESTGSGPFYEYVREMKKIAKKFNAV